MLETMRTVVLFLLLVIVVLVAYILVPVEQMQLQAKNTIRQAQSLNTLVDFDTVADEFGDLFEKQKERLSGEEVDSEEAEEDSTTTPEHVSTDPADPTNTAEESIEIQGEAVLVR